MRRVLRSELPGWLTSRSVAWAGALLAVLAISLSGGFVLYELREIEERDAQSVEMLARVLQDHGDRTFDTVDIALSALAETVRSSDRPLDPARLGATLLQSQHGMPFLRSLSLMDGRGRVLASSVKGNVGAVVDLERVILPGADRIARLGSLVAGRDLAQASPQSAGTTAAASHHNFVPLVRLANEAPEAPLYLVAVLNPDFFANEYQLLLADASRAAALFSFDGVMLTATDNIRLAPGATARKHRFFRDYLPLHESGAFIGPGVDGGEVVTAFRTLRKWPVSVFVERDYATVRADLARVAGRAAGVCAAALAIMGLMVGMAWRSLRSFEAVNHVLGSTRERVAANERDLRTLVEGVQELIFRTDEHGRIAFINGRWAQISGHPSAAALGCRLSELCVPQHRARVEALFASAAAEAASAHATGTVTESAMVGILTPQGALRTLELSVGTVREAEGSALAYVGFAVDVTERQLARGRLQAQLDFTARLIEVSPTPLFVKDDRGRFVTVNQAWLELMGLTREAVIGRSSAELFPGESQKHLQHDQRLLHTDQPVRYENLWQREGRPARDTVVTKVRFTHAGGSDAGIIGSIIDVTEFREAERTTREARDAAERAHRARSDFIADISHELRTPLLSIIGFAELGDEMAAAQPELQEMFTDIHAGGQRMLKLVNGLLDVSQMDSSVGSLALHRHDLGALMADVVDGLRPAAAKRSLELCLHRAAAPLEADVDPQRLQQAIRHVLDNALRFAPQGSRVDIRCIEPAGQGALIEVRDHGPGIPPGELESIFEAFAQSSRTRDGSGGTGLGLTIARRIVGAHGGQIVAANAPGGGALVSIRLPACLPAPDLSNDDPEHAGSPAEAGS
ncbi:hypothetical protein BH11PSE8_BH11PSE8_33120 [soil metagenome]